jgi:hypothetical protein
MLREENPHPQLLSLCAGRGENEKRAAAQCSFRLEQVMGMHDASPHM